MQPTRFGQACSGAIDQLDVHEQPAFVTISFDFFTWPGQILGHHLTCEHVLKAPGRELALPASVSAAAQALLSQAHSSWHQTSFSVNLACRWLLGCGHIPLVLDSQPCAHDRCDTRIVTTASTLIQCDFTLAIIMKLQWPVHDTVSI